MVAVDFMFFSFAIRLISYILYHNRRWVAIGKGRFCQVVDQTNGWISNNKLIIVFCIFFCYNKSTPVITILEEQNAN